MNRLTDAQRKFAEENHMLVLDYMNKKRLPIWESDPFTGEDWYGVICIAFCKAVATYKEGFGYSFSTYAYTCMENARKMVYRDNSAKKSIPVDVITSLDVDVFKDSNGGKEETGTLENLIGEKSFEDASILAMDLQRFIPKLSSKELEVLNMSIAGLKQAEIAQMIGYSQPHTYRIIKKIREKWEKYLK